MVARQPAVTGHLQVRERGGRRTYFASWIDRNGVKRTRTLGGAHVKDSGRRTARGAVIWLAASGSRPLGYLTPKSAEAALQDILDEARRTPPAPPAVSRRDVNRGATFGDAVDAWLTYLEVEKRRKSSTLQDARQVANAYLLPRFGRDTPLLRTDGQESLTTDDIDRFRRSLLASHLSPRTVQKILVLLHGVLKLAKRRKWIATNPSEDAERVTVEDVGTFNVLEPPEFEAVYDVLRRADDHAVKVDALPDAIDKLTPRAREAYGALLATSFYAGLRLGELRDLPRRNLDFSRSMIRVESSFTHGDRSTPKGRRARSTPMVPILAARLNDLTVRGSFTAGHDYVFCNELGERVPEAAIRAVFYTALARAGLGHRRHRSDHHGNPQRPIRVHDLRHSWCTWAVNVWPITKVQAYAGHRDVKTTQRYVHHQTKAEDADLGGAYLDTVLNTPAAS